MRLTDARCRRVEPAGSRSREVPVNDPLVQTSVVAIAMNIAGAGIAFYLWSEHRGERFLQFWAFAWTAGLIRWFVHLQTSSPPLLAIESVLISVTMFFMVLGSYDLLPS